MKTNLLNEIEWVVGNIYIAQFGMLEPLSGVSLEFPPQWDEQDRKDYLGNTLRNRAIQREWPTCAKLYLAEAIDKATLHELIQLAERLKGAK